MSMLWMFDITVVAKRSLICQWIATAETPREARALLNHHRTALHAQHSLRTVEHLPRPRGAAAYDEARSEDHLEEDLKAVRDREEDSEAGRKKCLVS
jgi:hypothetical protein